MEKAWDPRVLAGFRWTEAIWLGYATTQGLTDPYLTECSERVALRLVLGFIVYLGDHMNFMLHQIAKLLTIFEASSLSTEDAFLRPGS